MSGLRCFKCDDGSTPLYCLNCAGHEAARVAGTLADVIPALERASGLKADDFRKLAGGELTGNEVAALWLARAILEDPNGEVRDPAT